MSNTARVTTGTLGHQVIVNNEDVTGSCRSIIWMASENGNPPRLQIEMAVSETTTAEGQAQLVMDFGTFQLLTKHGWVAPPTGRVLPPVP